MKSNQQKQESFMADDPLSDLSMKPSRDDLASRKQQPKGRKRSHSVTPPPAQPVKASRNGPILVILLLIAAGSGTGGWLMWQEMESLRVELGQSKELLTQSQTNMGNLKENLASQTANMSKTGSQMEADLKLHFSEIDKLWNLSNKKNRPAIDKNSKAIAGLSSTLAQQKQVVAKAAETTAAAQQSIKALENQLKQDQLQGSAINAQVSELEGRLKEIAAQNTAFKNMLAAQEKDILDIQKRSGAALQAKLDDIAQRLDSIDAHRRQVNARLDQHGRNISELYKKP